LRRPLLQKLRPQLVCRSSSPHFNLRSLTYSSPAAAAVEPEAKPVEAAAETKPEEKKEEAAAPAAAAVPAPAP
jgi:hypothetical protein